MITEVKSWETSDGRIHKTKHDALQAEILLAASDVMGMELVDMVASDVAHAMVAEPELFVGLLK